MNFFIKLSRYITSTLEDILPSLIQMIKKQKPEITEETAESTIKHLWDIIPQGNKHILTPWLVKVYLKNNGYIDENRVRLLINTIYEAKNTFPNNFPKNFDINNYRDLDELESFLDPWIIKLSNIKEKHEEIEQSQELGEIFFQKGEYKILRIDNPKDIVEFLRINNVDSWCIKDMYYAKYYGPTWFLYKGNSIIVAYPIEHGELWDRNDQPMRGNPEAIKVFIEFLKQKGKRDEANELVTRLPMTKEEIDKYIDKGKYLDKLYINQTLTPEQIDKAIEKERYLDALYKHQFLTPEQIDKAIEKGLCLHALYYRKDIKFTPEQIDKAIEKGESLEILYRRKDIKFTPEQIDKAIEKEMYLDILYSRKDIKLTPEQIDKAIEKGWYLYALYRRKDIKFTPEQIDKAIEKGEELYTLYEYQDLTPEQKKKLERMLKLSGKVIESVEINKDYWETEDGRRVTEYARLYLKGYSELKKKWYYCKRKGEEVSSDVRREEYRKMLRDLAFELQSRTGWDYYECRDEILKRAEQLKQQRKSVVYTGGNNDKIY